MQMCPGQGFLNRSSPNVASILINAASEVSGLSSHTAEVLAEKRSCHLLAPATESRACPQAAPLGFEPFSQVWHSYS